MTVKTFWVEKLPIRDWTVYVSANGPCPVHGDEHRAETAPVEVTQGQEPPRLEDAPAACACGYAFKPEDHRHGTGRPRWRRMDTGEELRGKLPPGALFVDEPFTVNGWDYKGADGLNIVCVLPNGHHWWIDSRASNCTKMDDNVHRCWIRHGTVGEPLHVDKSGNTCAAGAGSIMSGDYHGFLHHGVLT